NLIELSKALLFTLKDTHTNALYDNTPISSRETILEIVQKAFPIPDPPLQPEPVSAPAANPEPMEAEADSKQPESEAAADGDHPAEATKESPKEADKDTDSDAPADTDKPKPDEAAMDVEKPAEDVKMEEGDSKKNQEDEKRDEKEDEKATSDDTKTDKPEESAASGTDKPVESTELVESAKDGGSEAKILEDDAGAKPEPPKSDAPTSKPSSDTNASRHQTPDASAPKPNTPATTPQQTQQAAQALHAQQAQQTLNTLAARLSPENSRLVMSFLALIIKELANPSAEVRETVKACLDILVKVTGCSITALLTPCRDRLLVPIFGKPLRALPHNMQIGNIDAITYCMSLEPPFMEINEELMRLLSEALALADAEDQALVNHPAQIRSNTVSLTHLRHVCIRMLTAAMDRPELSQSRHNTTRARIISVFFKSLYHKSIDV
ncbi:transcription-associated protein 1, partial [Linderina pennispora]